MNARILANNVLLLLLGTCGASFCQGDEPVGWGVPRGAKGCVIFREYERIDWTNAEIDLNTTGKPHFELAVVSSDGYMLSKATWSDDQATLDELQQLAIKDEAYFVKLKDHYSPQDLDAARSLCRQAMTPVS